MAKPTVFISSSSEGLDVAHALRAHLQNDASVKLWHEGAFSFSRPILESLDAEASKTDFAIFILTLGDLTAARGGGRLPANYLIELGYFMGRIGSSRTFILIPDSPQHFPTDLQGVLYLTYSSGPEVDLITALGPTALLIRNAIRELQAREERPSEFYSCFISYSSSDKVFAEKLYDDLQQVGIRCWLDARDLKTGDLWKEQIDRAIQVHEKVLLVLSHASIQSRWVQREIEKVLDLERVSGKTILFPIRLDDSIFETTNATSLELIREKQIEDFKGWQDQKSYRRAFSRLLRDLMISTSVETKEAV